MKLALAAFEFIVGAWFILVVIVCAETVAEWL